MNQTERLAHESARRIHRLLHSFSHRTEEPSTLRQMRAADTRRASASYPKLMAEIQALAAWLLREESLDFGELATTLQSDPLIVPVPGGYIQLEFRMLRDLATLAKGCWEPRAMALMRELLEPGQTVIDVGAHIGHFTILAAGTVGPQGKVFAFEPAPSNVARLRQNLELNRFECAVEVIEQALSEQQQGKVSFYDDGNTFGTEYSLLAQGERPEAFTTTCTTLDAFARRRRLERVDLIKIDVEGAELRVLEGMPRTLEAHPQVKLILELHPELVSPSRICQSLGRQGFELYDVDRELEPFTVDDADRRFDRTGTLLATHA